LANRSLASAKVLTLDEARRVASNIAKLPLLLSKRSGVRRFTPCRS
jgi:hypothetical protein